MMSGRIWRMLGLIFALGLAFAVGATAIGEAFGRVEVPFALLPLWVRQPRMFPLHMAAGGLTLILVPLAILLRYRPRWHRPVARLASFCVIVAGLSALPVALASPATATARMGFFVQGCVWLALLAVGIWAIRRKAIRVHALAMILMTAVAAGAIVLRGLLVVQAELFPDADFDTAYAGMAWASWLLPLGLILAWGLARAFRQPLARA